MKNFSLNNNNIANPQKYYQTIVLFENTNIMAIIKKDSAVFNLIDKKLKANFNCIILFIYIFNITINNDSQMVNSDLNNNSLGGLYKSEIVLKCKGGMYLLFLFLIKGIN